MKRLKRLKLLKFLTLICSVFIFNTKVYAQASATVEFSSNSTVSVGEKITVTMYISNVNDTTGGIVSAGGNLSFDSSYLEYVSATGVTSPYSFQINPSASYKIAGLDTSLSNGINSKTKVFTFVFKALKIGSTTVTLNNASLTDTAQKVSTSVSPKSITITEAVPKSSDATLKSLGVTGYTLSPSFSASTTSYKITVPADVSSVTLSAIANHNGAKVSGAGSIKLTSDSTNVTVKVTAEDGTTKNYTVTINKEASTSTPTPTPSEPTEDPKSNDATLKSLDVSGYSLSPTFKNNINTYSMKVKNNITGLNVTAIPTSDKATIAISGNKNWKEGVNIVTIKVTAEDGSVNTYIVNVTRESSNTNSTTTTKSSDNYLKSLIINSSHEINPKFNKDVSNYEIIVPYEVEKLDFSYVRNNIKAKVEITGNENFKDGEVNIVQITVTAEDGTKRVYTLNINRTTAKSDNNLKELSVKNGELTPKFESEILEYSVKVDGDTTELDITAIAENNESKVEIIGNKNLKEGHNTILVKVTDKNGFTKYYTIDVEKAAKETRILGFTPLQFGILTGILILLLVVLILLIILLKRRKRNKNEFKNENENKSVSPIIEVKPEFNFGSKNTSDDDVVHGNLNQNSHVLSEPKTSSVEAIEADYEEKMPYDPYDYTVTKREIVDAIYEATKTKDPAKLKMLLEQDALNQRKKEIKRREEEAKAKEKEETEENWR